MESGLQDPGLWGSHEAAQAQGPVHVRANEVPPAWDPASAEPQVPAGDRPHHGRAWPGPADLGFCPVLGWSPSESKVSPGRQESLGTRGS